MNDSQHASRNTVDVIVPLEPQHGSTLRVVAASLGADAGFSVDEIDDFRLAVSEVFSVFSDAAPGGRVRASFSVEDGRVAAEMTGVDQSVAIELDELATTILRSVIDEFETSDGHVRLAKSASEAVS